MENGTNKKIPIYDVDIDKSKYVTRVYEEYALGRMERNGRQRIGVDIDYTPARNPDCAKRIFIEKHNITKDMLKKNEYYIEPTGKHKMCAISDTDFIKHCLILDIWEECKDNVEK